MTRRTFLNHLFAAIFVVLTQVYWPVKSQAKELELEPAPLVNTIGPTPGPLARRSLKPMPLENGWVRLSHLDKYGHQWYVKP